MKILFIAGSDPRDVSDGAHQRTNLMWRALKAHGEVYTVVTCFASAPEIDSPGDRIKSVAVWPDGWRAKVRSLIYNHFYKPTIWPFSTPFLRSNPWKEVKFDLVAGRYLDSVYATQAWKLAPMAVDIDDWPPETHRTIWAGKYWAWWRPWARLVVDWWTRRALSKCRAVWVANSEHAKFARSHSLPCEYLPNRARMPATPPDPALRTGSMLLTVGLMGHMPNYEGVDRFLRETWPAVRAKFPDMEYFIAGRNAPEAYEKRWRAVPGVKVLGFVEDLDALYAKASAVVAPVFSGSGTCIKVLEGAVHGKAVFAAEAAMRGYDGATRERLGMFPLEKLLEVFPAITPEMERAIAAAAAEFNSIEFFNRQVDRLIAGLSDCQIV